MVAGFLAITAPAASATGATAKWYVATSGTDVSNACTVKSFPCQTLGHALAEQAASGVGGIIKVGAGTYTEQLSITPANDNVTIKGAKGGTTVIQPPQTGLLSDTDTDSSNPEYYVIDVAPGTVRLGLSSLSVSGANGTGFLDGDGQGCGQDYVGIYYHEASGSINNVSVNGIDMPADLFGCQGGQGVYVDSSASGASTVSMNAVSMLSPAPSTKTTADLPAGSYTNDQLAVAKVPAGFTSGEITVNGFAVSATKDSGRVLLITGTTGADSPKGSVVRLEASLSLLPTTRTASPATTSTTSCTITNSTVQGEGPNNLIAQNGIQDFGAGATTISGNTISGDSYSGGGAGNLPASGILVLNAGTVSVENNNVSTSDVNIFAGEIPQFGLVAAPVGQWTIGGNTVSGATISGASTGAGGYGVGIQLDSTSNQLVVEGNTVTTSKQADLPLTGDVSNASIVVPSARATRANSFGGSQAGVVFSGPGSACAFASSCESRRPLLWQQHERVHRQHGEHQPGRSCGRRCLRAERGWLELQSGRGV